MKKEVKFFYEEYPNEKSLAANYQTLLINAKQAAQNAYSPYSKFNVGASLLLDNGIIVRGNNQENAAYPSGLCAERIASLYASSEYPDNKPVAIAIVAYNTLGFSPKPLPPCGACRQVLLEIEQRFGENIKAIMYGTERIIIANSIKDLLPFCFDSTALV